MVKISLCMIVKNEEAVLQRCLNSVKQIADEIIIVDTGSTDTTKEIAAKFTKKIYDFDWIDDFSEARNFSFSKATKDFIMWFDADDVVLESDKQKMIELKKNLSNDIDVVTMKYNIGFDSDGKPTFHSIRGRWFNRLKNPTWCDEIHEYIPLVGNILSASDIHITHKPNKKGVSNRNINIYEKMLKRDGKLSPRGRYYFARELNDHGRFAEAATHFEEFLKQGEGWVEDNIAACYNLSLCYSTLGQPEKAFRSLQKSFKYDAPRAEICCLIGYYYKDKGDYKTAASWFETALKIPKQDGMGFVLKDFHAFIPAIELSVCYDKLGKTDIADQYNEIAGSIKPNSHEYIHNKNYFSQVALR